MDVARLQRLARVLRETAATAAAESGDDRLGPGALAVIEDLARHEATTVGEVARRTGLAQSMVSTTVAGLRSSGVLTSEPDPDDGRRVLVTLSAATRSQILTRSARPADGALREALLRASRAAGRGHDAEEETGDPRGPGDLDDPRLAAAAADLERLLDEVADRLL